MAAGQMAEKTGRRVGVIGAGMVGVCAASWLQRDGHSVFLIEPGKPGEGASFGNAGCFNGSSVTPVAMPGVHPQRAGLALRPARAVGAALDAICRRSLPWLARFIRAGDAGEGAGGGARLAPARRADPRSLERAGRATPAPRISSIISAISMSIARPRAWRRIALAWELAARERGRDRRIRRRRIAPAGARPVARVCARPAGARKRPYLEPARLGRPPRRALPCARAASSCGHARIGFRLDGGRLDRDRDRRRRARRPMPRSSAPGPIRSRSPPRSATRCRSKPSAAIT